MQDNRIIDLFWDRDEAALSMASEAYGAYCRSIAQNILRSAEDAEECVNDTWLRAWNAIPPQRPRRLAVFLGKITRNLAIDRYKARTAEKRGGGETETLLSELAECVADANDVEGQIFARDLETAMNHFVRGLPRREGDAFVRRYYFAESADQIARRYDMTTNHVMVTLSRTRKKLRSYLKKEGYL